LQHKPYLVTFFIANCTDHDVFISYLGNYGRRSDKNHENDGPYFMSTDIVINATIENKTYSLKCFHGFYRNTWD